MIALHFSVALQFSSLQLLVHNYANEKANVAAVELKVFSVLNDSYSFSQATTEAFTIFPSIPSLFIGAVATDVAAEVFISLQHVPFVALQGSVTVAVGPLLSRSVPCGFQPGLRPHYGNRFASQQFSCVTSAAQVKFNTLVMAYKNINGTALS
ncbi:hypothetical protein Z043_124530 [Scleropages formosus]|uniref:SEA domain-containing protein n=1 Tax=Scleropages formosus TaxID=113540 RepID=A0A0N8JVC1_SCLFO|nr:hypothetical protein Z043_124530 [Scleropages formosus]